MPLCRLLAPALILVAACGPSTRAASPSGPGPAASAAPLATSAPSSAPSVNAGPTGAAPEAPPPVTSATADVPPPEAPPTASPTSSPAPPEAVGESLGPGSVVEIESVRWTTVNPSETEPPPQATRYREVYTVVRRLGGSLEVEVRGGVIPARPGAAPEVRTMRVPAVVTLPAKAPAGALPPSLGEPRRVRLADEKITTPAGHFDCAHVQTTIVQMSSGTTADEWFAPGIPLPIKSASVTGAGATIYQRGLLVRLVVK